jgi:hypothetical protein
MHSTPTSFCLAVNESSLPTLPLEPTASAQVATVVRDGKVLCGECPWKQDRTAGI